MSFFRKVDTRIWNDAKFSGLQSHGQLAFLFILTHPHMTSLGAMRATPEGLAAELGWNPKAFREAFHEVVSKGMVEVDEKASYVGLPNFLKYNRPESPNVVKSWQSAIERIPECRLKHQLIQRVKDFTEGLGEAFAKALPEAFRKGMPNQKQKAEAKAKERLIGVSAEALYEEEPVLQTTEEFIREWKKRIKPVDFGSLGKGSQFVDEAIRAGLSGESDRLRILVLWHRMAGRVSKNPPKHPAGLFLSLWRKAEWDGTETDEQHVLDWLSRHTPKRTSLPPGLHHIADRLAVSGVGGGK